MWLLTSGTAETAISFDDRRVRVYPTVEGMLRPWNLQNLPRLSPVRGPKDSVVVRRIDGARLIVMRGKTARNGAVGIRQAFHGELKRALGSLAIHKGFGFARTISNPGSCGSGDDDRIGICRIYRNPYQVSVFEAPNLARPRLPCIGTFEVAVSCR